MKLKIYKSLWGMIDRPMSESIEKIGKSGYHGVEWIKPDFPNREFRALLDDHGLDYIGLIPAHTIEALKIGMDEIMPLKPLQITVHGGRDDMNLDEGLRYFEAAHDIEKQYGVPLCFETHRRCLLYCPWQALEYFNNLPDLKIVADFSHWVNVCERCPDDQAEALAGACRSARHIHGRVGFNEGPQVGDPAAPEYAGFLLWHEKQWDRIRDEHAGRDAEVLSFTPEFGPVPYMPALPHTGAPVADLWQVCLWMANRTRERWSDLLD